MSLRWASFSSVFLRYALGLGFLSAVADRFGLWGPFGQPNVGWGNFSRFLEYTATVNPYAPAGMIPALGVIVVESAHVARACSCDSGQARPGSRLRAPARSSAFGSSDRGP